VKFAIGYQLPDEDEPPFADLVGEFREHIAEVYFPWLDIPSGRSPIVSQDEAEKRAARAQLEQDLLEMRRLGVKLDLLLNASCYGREAYSIALVERISSLIAYLRDLAGLDIITTMSPLIAEAVRRRFPDVEVRASVNMRLGTVRAMEYVAHLFDSYHVQRECNRDLERLEELHAWAEANGKQLLLLVNSGCLSHCAVQTFHDNLVSHEAEAAEMVNVAADSPALCWSYYRDRRNWVRFLQNTWVRPEDLHHYENRFPVVKLATRMHASPRRVLRAYVSGHYSGGLPDLLEPGHGRLFAPYMIDNRGFPEDWFARTSACGQQCGRCDYCASVLARVLVNGEAESAGKDLPAGQTCDIEEIITSAESRNAKYRRAEMPRLTVLRGEDEGEVFTLRDVSVGIGTAADNFVRINDAAVSRHHGHLSPAGERWLYRDLGSTNGSVIERAGLQIVLDRQHFEIELEPEDLLLVGETVLCFEAAEATDVLPPEHTLIASRDLEDLEVSRQRQLANLDDLLAAYQLEREIGLAFGPEETMDAILEATLKAFPTATHAILLLVDKQSGRPKRQVARIQGEDGRAKEEIVVSMTVAKRVLQEGKSLLFQNVLEEFANSKSVAAARINSSLCVPLWTGEESVGLLQVESRGAKASFTERDLDRLCLFGNRAALAILASELHDAESRNQLLRDLSAMITHDLKGPLTTIIGFLSLLSEEPLGARQKEYVEVALADSQWLSVLIGGILDTAKMEAKEMRPRLQPLDMKAQVEQALALLTYQIQEKQIRLETAIAEGLPQVHADPEVFQRIIVNLVGNAVKFAPERSRICVRAALDSAGDSVIVSVQDEGPGIAREYQSVIFDKFVQVSARRSAEKISVGLGLAFCKLAVEAHGGKIWVESEPGEGSCFSFSLPLGGEAPA
jgi:signal transduction histidine kinase/collagenase-like PrtC family protease